MSKNMGVCMVRKLLTIIFLLILSTSTTNTIQASVVDFDDLISGTIYNVGDSFISSGVLMTVVDFQWSGGTWVSDGNVPIGNGLLAGGYGNELEWINNANVDFDFGGIVNDIAFQFMDGGGNLNIEINGDFRNINEFSDIDGLSVGGTSVVLAGTPSYGTLYINGTINSFSVGGQELNIDNVWYVPEPATLLMLSLGGLILRRRC